MTAIRSDVRSRASFRSLLAGRAHSLVDLIAYFAAMLVTIGVGFPTVMMINGAIRLDITYYWWAWAGLPAIWLPAVAAALLLRTSTGPSSLVLFLASVFGIAFFWPEYGLFTYGPVCVLAALVYLREMQRTLGGGEHGGELGG